MQLLCRAGTSEGTMQCLRGSLQLLTKKDLKKAELFVKSAQPLLLDTPESCTLSEHSRPPQRRTAAWPGGEEREKGRRPSQLRVLPLLANYRLPKGRTFILKIKKIKTYKKRDRQTNKVQQSQKRKKLFLFLHFFIYS